MLRATSAFLFCLTGIAAQQDAAATKPDSPAYREVDYAALDRTIMKEPAYTAEPRYAMFIFDVEGKHRVWCAADKSNAKLAYYDVLYMDLDGDGDLTEAGERFTGTYSEQAAAAGMGLTIRVGDIKVPGTDLVHTKFLVSTTPKAERNGFWFRMHWNGKHEMSGGYGVLGSNTTVWQGSAPAAPVFRPCPLGPLSFATWGDDEIVLRPGGSTHINVIAGNGGFGKDAMAVVDENFLDIVRDELLVTVIAKDKQGNEVSETSRIKEHC